MCNTRIVAAFLSLATCLGTSAALGQTTCPVTYTFSNGTTADATQVNRNFSDLTNCAVPASNPIFLTYVGVGTTLNGGWRGTALMEVKNPGVTGLSVYGLSAVPGSRALGVRVDSTNEYLTEFWYTTSSVGTISTNGTSTTYGTSSDARLKTVDPVQTDLGGVIRELWVGGFKKWADFSHTGQGTPSFGVLAQQAYSVLPIQLRDIAIAKPKDTDGKWMASSEPFAYLALWGVKDIYRQHDLDRKRIASLETSVSQLQMQVSAQAVQTARLQSLLKNLTHQKTASR